MHNVNDRRPRMAIACGGTGGHLFPGIAVANQLLERGCAVTLLVSAKDVDQQIVKRVTGMEVVTLPAIGLTRRRALAFVGGFSRSYGTAKRLFKRQRPHAALAMGGFVSAPPILAAKSCGTPTFLHESNTIPGRANRWLSLFVNRAFVGFPTAAKRLSNRCVTPTGTPVRPQFLPKDAAACRIALGLDPNRPVVTVVGGSQGASGINDLLIESLPVLAKLFPKLQWFHLAGQHDCLRVAQAYADLHLRAVVHPFFNEMELALGAASVAISRAGASSLAELAAMRLPAVLVPYPVATDNHQFHNARAFAQTGAALLLEQHNATPASLSQMLHGLLENQPLRHNIQAALSQWHAPNAAEQIAENMLRAIAEPEPLRAPLPSQCPEPYRLNA
jgi:UDP-N-acetylglucosamine--N-acetylmuramyl-(pentapeptide) pyrophosphoryl-undecaprenol N-acetylglucosamine transferase